MLKLMGYLFPCLTLYAISKDARLFTPPSGAFLCLEFMSEHFSEKEFVCRCGTCGKGFNDINAISFGRLCTARILAGVPFIILSSIRCKTQNHIAGGVEGSAHLTGQAFDIKAIDSRTRFKIIEACLNAGFKRIGVSRGFIHVDDDQTKDQEVAWIY